MLMFRLTKIGKSFTREQHIQELAAYSTITPYAIELLDKFFQNKATAEERNELDQWLQESGAYNQLFDLLLELDFKHTPIATISLLRRLFSQADTGIFPV